MQLVSLFLINGKNREFVSLQLGYTDQMLKGIRKHSIQLPKQLHKHVTVECGLQLGICSWASAATQLVQSAIHSENLDVDIG